MDKDKQVSTAWLLGSILKNMRNLKASETGEERELIVNEIRNAVDELESIRMYFNSVNDPELLDYAIYREKAAILRLSYLLKKAKYDNEILKSTNM
ncbi:DUF2508 family protein [Fonticella tunisiensis]|uniref:Uncharacterized protein DUF2508 n=1 Tax=Fonticella tunisiensis TaxID=1096341 RepID=A0A4R7KAZ7_9CLOT|nr:DUF2508 family protein [Fonticella tunisiensis]TDT50260.1 uncharacterized protein DUF2508 [Fonticella tunisiensis]